LLALFPQLFAHSTYNWALRYLPVTVLSIALLAEPIGSTAFAFILLKEMPTILMIAGAVLVLIGVFLASSRSNQTRNYN
jgi:drug/metabolite transporter (DMT)-like permease